MLFDQNDRVLADLLCRFVLLHHEVHIGIRTLFHFIGVVVRYRTPAPHMKGFLQLVLAKSMCGCSFSGCL